MNIIIFKVVFNCPHSHGNFELQLDFGKLFLVHKWVWVQGYWSQQDYDLSALNITALNKIALNSIQCIDDKKKNKGLN